MNFYILFFKFKNYKIKILYVLNLYLKRLLVEGGPAETAVKMKVEGGNTKAKGTVEEQVQ